MHNRQAAKKISVHRGKKLRFRICYWNLLFPCAGLLFKIDPEASVRLGIEAMTVAVLDLLGPAT